MVDTSSIVALIRNDLPKLLRFAAVSLFTVPLGIFLLWILLRTGMDELLANLIGVTLSTIPNYLLNRYWVWNKKGRNSVAGEILPFWAMAFLGLAMSTLFIWIARLFTDVDVVYLAANFCAFGLVWILKFFVLERFLFGDRSEVTEPVAS